MAGTHRKGRKQVRMSGEDACLLCPWASFSPARGLMKHQSSERIMTSWPRSPPAISLISNLQRTETVKGVKYLLKSERLEAKSCECALYYMCCREPLLAGALYRPHRRRHAGLLMLHHFCLGGPLCVNQTSFIGGS